MNLVESYLLHDETNRIFEEWKAIFEHKIPNSKIEHIGSTAIPGALTKGDIDIYVEVPANIHSKVVTIIESLGFAIKLDTHRDDDLCMLESKTISTLAIQVVARGSKYEFFLVFRDALKNNPLLVLQYNDIKKSAVDAPQGEYRKLKSVFIKRIVGENE